MRFALWLLGLFALASALALFVGDNEGVVSLFWPPHRIDLSVNLALLLLLLLSALIWLCARALGALLTLPRAARRWRALQRERAMSQHLVEALANLLAGRYLRARKQALAVLAHRELLEAQAPGNALTPWVAMTHVLLAESAHALQDKALRERHVAQAMAAAGDPRGGNVIAEAVHLQNARWALEDRDGGRALSLLDELPPAVGRRTMALRWRLRAHRTQGDADGALGAGRLLAKHHAFERGAAAAILRSLVMARLAQAHDAGQLERVWRDLDEAERRWPEVAASGARRMIALGGAPARALEWLEPAWSQMVGQSEVDADWPIERRVALVDTALDCLAGAAGAATTLGADDAHATLGKAWLARFEQAQRQRPGDAVLRYAAGLACHGQGLWGMSQQLLTSTAQASALPDHCRARVWRALADLAERRGDTAAALDAWKRAATLA